MKIKEDVMKIAKEVSSCIQTNPDLLKRSYEIWAENKRLDKEIEMVRIQNETEIIKITQRYELFRDVLISVFGERQTALHAHYKTLDKALENNDRELVIAALKGISSIVVQNPLESFAEFSKVLNDDNLNLNLDF